jgi:hypothetical protein
MSPPTMRARLLSLFTIVSFGLQPVAYLLVGYSAERLGVQTAIQIYAHLLLAGAVLMLVFRTELRLWQVNTAEMQPISAAEVIS